MNTQTIGTIRERWRMHLRGDGWRDQVADWFRRLIGNNVRPRIYCAGAAAVTIRLTCGEPVHLRECSGLRAFHVRRGIVWLTGTPANGDVILYLGDRFEFGNQWPFVLQALEAAEIEFSD